MNILVLPHLVLVYQNYYKEHPTTKKTSEKKRKTQEGEKKVGRREMG